MILHLFSKCNETKLILLYNIGLSRLINKLSLISTKYVLVPEGSLLQIRT